MLPKKSMAYTFKCKRYPNISIQQTKSPEKKKIGEMQTGMETTGGLGHFLNSSTRDGLVQPFLNACKIPKKCIIFLSVVLPSFPLLSISEFKYFSYLSEEEKHLSSTLSFTKYD